jgi:cytochrome c553
MNARKTLFMLSLVFTFASTTVVADEYAAIRETIELCEGCHGKNGASTEGEFPVLAGQEFYYLYVQLKDFKSGLRKSEIMSPTVAELEKKEFKALAKFYSEQTWPNIGFKGDEARIRNGETAATAGQCVACHLGSYTGNSRVPRLAGQHPGYLKKTMLEMKDKVRNNSPAVSTLMSSFSEADIADIAVFLGNM